MMDWAEGVAWIEFMAFAMLWCCGFLISLTLFTGLLNFPSQSVTIYVNKESEGFFELVITSILLIVSFVILLKKAKGLIVYGQEKGTQVK